jgi:hypothetical protein
LFKKFEKKAGSKGKVKADHTIAASSSNNSRKGNLFKRVYSLGNQRLTRSKVLLVATNKMYSVQIGLPYKECFFTRQVTITKEVPKFDVSKNKNWLFIGFLKSIFT